MISQGAVTYAAWKVKTPLEVSSVMSGLLGLRLWKFEITTDAPDTYNAPRFSIQQNVAQNPSRKLRAQKSQVHGLADCDTKGKST